MHGKRKPLARLAALLLSGCLLLALSGCRTGDGGESSVDDRVPDENGVFATGYPIVKEPITLKVLTYDLNNGFKPEDTALMQELEKKTNIHLEWTVTTGYAAANLQAAYASGDLPDILTGFYCDIAYQWPYIEQGMILQLDDWIPRYAPNVQAMFKQVPYAQYMSTALDGNIYSLPNVTVGSANSSFMGMLINQKWLDVNARVVHGAPALDDTAHRGAACVQKGRSRTATGRRMRSRCFCTPICRRRCTAGSVCPIIRNSRCI